MDDPGLNVFLFVCRDRDILITNEAYKVYSSCMYRPSFEKYEEEMEGFLNDESYTVFVAEHGNDIKGMLVLNLSGNRPEIEGIAVFEDFRRKGLGRCMILGAMERLKTDSIIAETDDGAVDFYRACGFSVRKILREYPDGTAVRYICELSK